MYLTDSGYVANYLRDRLLTSTLTTGGVTKTLAQNYYDNKIFGQPGSSACYGYWGQDYSGTPATLYDSAPPVAFGNRGYPSASVNPAKTTCLRYYMYGAAARMKGTDGSQMAVSADAATNYAAPQTITTQSYGESLA